ncbi:hypothetical protein BCR42DRAFT_409493 [Absidia repens]|uniref:Uncharacterized protein n=1 Tax=Absidia repens TaxID=90262 RepID=A0A1X2IR69_9FUNG|nr:hypothetical protein BCR42DRAFT_409493 [Absidia repens]
MSRRSRRTISDDIHCINSPYSSKNVFIWLSILLCFCPIIIANAAINDTNPNLLSILGLPRKNHCALYYNNALFILNGQSIESSLAIKFTNDSFLASSAQFPSIQWIENKNDTNVQQKLLPSASSASICTVTSYGQAILFRPDSLQNNDTIDLNTLKWTSTSTELPPANFTTVAAASMNDDTILVLGENNNTLSTWILDASDDQLQWIWTQLTLSLSSPLFDSTLISTSMTTTTSYILYFGVNQPSSTNMYNVSVYCFDISSLTWMGSLLNFTSTTNHIQSVMINNNNINNAASSSSISSSKSSSKNKNDTLLIVPDWIDTTMIHATSFDINVTNADAEKNQQTQQRWRWQYQQQKQKQLPDNDDGFWLLNIDASSSSSASLPSVDLIWQPTSNGFDSMSGGSTTLVGDTVVFYGGEVVTRGTPSLGSSSSSRSISISRSISTGTDSNSNLSQLRFWNVSNRSFLATPAWLAPFIPSSSAPPTLSNSPNDAGDGGNNDNGDNKVIIILATLLGVFGCAFLWILGLYLWRRKKQQRQQGDRQLERGTTAMGSASESTATAHRHNTPRIDQNDNAATWAEQLHRSFSTMLQRLRPSTSSSSRRKSAAAAAATSASAVTTTAGLAISAPLVSSEYTTDQHQQQHEDKGIQQQQQLQQQHQNHSHHTLPTPISPSTPSPSPLPPMSSSNLSNSAPQSTRNSWREGSLKASRFVEHF